MVPTLGLNELVAKSFLEVCAHRLGNLTPISIWELCAETNSLAPSIKLCCADHLKETIRPKLVRLHHWSLLCSSIMPIAVF